MSIPVDDINPQHYCHAAIECIEVAEQLSYNLGNAVKYAWRYQHKGNPAKDLRKCAWYLRREAERCKKLWWGARLRRWFKLMCMWEKYAGDIPMKAASIISAAISGNFAREAAWLESVAQDYETFGGYEDSAL